MPVPQHLGLDLGGTNIKWTVVESAGSQIRVVARGQELTDRSDGEATVIDQLSRLAATVCGTADAIASVGIGVPGLYNPADGTTRFLPNMPGEWSGAPVAAGVGAAVGLPVRLINDARAFTLAEHRVGAGRGVGSMLGMTLGTGIGGGLILGGELYTGHDGTAGEVGHQTIVANGPRCTCGNRGCLETLARADVIAASCGQPTVELAVAAALSRDVRARRGMARAGRFIGIGISNAIVLATVDRVVIGGGVAASGDLIFKPIRAEVERRVFVTDVKRVDIVAGELGIWAGAIGAALYASSK